MSNDPFRTPKAILKNAFLWGTALGVLSGTLITAYVFVVPGPGVESLPERIGEALFAGASMGVRFALGGAVIGTLFAVGLRYAYRGRKLAQVRLLRAAIIGALVGGVGIPLFYQLLNVLTDGHMIPWNLVTDDSIWASIFGALAASGTIWFARRAAALPAEAENRELTTGNGIDAVGATELQRRAKVDR